MTDGMFVGHQTQIPMSYDSARSQLARLIDAGSLASMSQDVYGEGMTALLRVGPGRPGQGISRLVQVKFREIVSHGGSSVLTFRWEARGTGGGLFPALDADLTLRPMAADRCVLRVDGVYRPPLGSVGAAIDRVFMNRVAAATIRDFVVRLATAIAPAVPGPAPGPAAGDPGLRRVQFQAPPVPLADPLI